MVPKLSAVTLNTLEPEEVQVCRDCGMVHVEERGCPLCALLKKASKLKDSEKSLTAKEMVDWLYSEEEAKRGFLD